VLNLDEDIERFVADNPKLTIPGVIRDIARIFCIFKLIEERILDDDTVVCGGMALRCYNSERFTTYDTDTSTAMGTVDRQALARALDFETDDIRVRTATPQEWDYGHKLITAQPITYEPFFTTLDAGDATFSLTVSHRGLERKAVWREIVTGYPFMLGIPPESKIPVMDLYEILAEKIVSWWLFGHAKHYADIGYIGALLRPKDLYLDLGVKKDVAELVAKKLEVNEEQHESRVKELTPAVRSQRLEDPLAHMSSKNNWSKVSYLGKQQWTLNQAQHAVVSVIVPLLS
jgi:hypothetical protein